MMFLLNLIFISVLICYFFLKQNYIELTVIISFLIFFFIYNRCLFLSFIKDEIKLIQFSYFYFIPIIIFTTIVYFTLGTDYIYTSQDALAIWGNHTKWIYENNKLWDHVATLNFKKNIPGVSIYEYLFISIFGFTEKNIVLSLHFLSFLSLSTAVKKVFKDKFDFLIITPMAFIVLPLFGYAFVDIMVDGLLASIVTLYTIMVFLFFNQKEKYYNLIPISIFLVMIKPVGIWYVVFIPVFLGIYSFLFYKKKNSFLQNIYMILVLFPTLYIWNDWQNYITLIDSRMLPLFSFNEYLSLEFINKVKKVMMGFHSWAMNGNFLLLKIIELPYYITYLILNLITIFLLKKQFNITKTLLIFSIINCFFIFNLFTYLYLMVIYFHDYEAENVASIGRYFGIIHITWVIISSFLIYKKLIKPLFISNRINKFITLIILGMISVATLIFTQNYFLKLGPSKEAIKDFKVLKANFDLNNKGDNSKIYFISQGNVGHEASLFFYMLSPYTKSHGCWSLTNKIILGKIMHWDCKGSLISYLDGYTHVYIDKLDINFINEQKYFFKNNKVNEKSLYLVNFNPDKKETYLTLE